jgi:glucan 1,3-beta-glucosidase
VPPGSRIVGDVWSVISAAGSKFKSSENPRPMIQVGKPGEVGLAEFSDMLFTVADVLPGAILVEVNMRGQHQGDVSFHNVHYRIGGAADSLTETICNSDASPCKAAFLVMHLKETSSSYIENAWLWTADHDLDGTNPTSVGTGRGMLVEATQGTWLVGTGSEHHTLYGYTLYNAQNVITSLMQVETPYSAQGSVPLDPECNLARSDVRRVLRERQPMLHVVGGACAWLRDEERGNIWNGLLGVFQRAQLRRVFGT